MPVREIVVDGAPVLRLKARNVRRFGARLHDLIADMFETMHDAHGVGLAAPQIGLSERIIVIEIPEDMEDEPEAGTRLALVNPEIVKAKGEEAGPEGCLSVPDFRGDVKRATQVMVKGYDADGREVRTKAFGYLARVLQHEIDHLDGVLFTDKVEEGTLEYIGEEPLPEPASEESTA